MTWISHNTTVGSFEIREIEINLLKSNQSCGLVNVDAGFRGVLFFGFVSCRNTKYLLRARHRWKPLSEGKAKVKNNNITYYSRQNAVFDEC